MFRTRLCGVTIAPSCLSLLLITSSARAILSPDAAYCEAMGYRYTMDQTPEGALGMCELPDGRRVNALDFVAGKVAREFSYCARRGHEAKHVETSEACNNCLVCVMPDGSEVEVTRLMDLNLLETTCGDGTCGIPENFKTCPDDCPSGGADGFCDGELDGRVDPDCEEAEEPDLGQAPASDLAATQADAPDPVVVRRELTYVLTVKNNGPDAATGVTLVDALPADVEFLSAPPACSEAEAVVTCQLGDLAPDATASIEVVVAATDVGTLTNSASVSGDQADPVAENNITTEDTKVRAGGGKCFIAIAAHGSYLGPEVMALRGLRDRHLLTNRFGRQLVRHYYQVSPPLADYLRDHAGLRMVTRWVLTPLIYGVRHPLAAGLLGAAGLLWVWLATWGAAVGQWMAHGRRCEPGH